MRRLCARSARARWAPVPATPSLRKLFHALKDAVTASRLPAPNTISITGRPVSCSCLERPAQVQSITTSPARYIVSRILDERGWVTESGRPDGPPAGRGGHPAPVHEDRLLRAIQPRRFLDQRLRDVEKGPGSFDVRGSTAPTGCGSEIEENPLTPPHPPSTALRPRVRPGGAADPPYVRVLTGSSRRGAGGRRRAARVTARSAVAVPRPDAGGATHVRPEAWPRSTRRASRSGVLLVVLRDPDRPRLGRWAARLARDLRRPRSR
jgi:hypothetical protein